MSYRAGDADRGRVVVGVDTTLSGLHALRLAVTEARARGRALHAVRTWGPTPSDQLGQPAAGAAGIGVARGPVTEDGGPAGRTTIATLAAAIVDRAFAETMGGEPPDVPVRTVLVPDLPGPVLVEYACRDDDLLVVGSGRRRLLRPRGSPVVRYCLRHASCPVLVVPPPALARAGSPRAMLRELRREIDQLTERADQ